MEKLAGHLVPVYDFFHEIKGFQRIEIHPGQIHRYGNDRISRFLQTMVNPGGGFNDIAVQKMDKLHLLQHRNEVAGKNHALFRILPPGQGFHTADLSRQGSGNGLVVHMDMALFHGIFKIPKHKGRIHHIPAHRWIVHCPAPVPIFPDRVRRHFGHIENIPALQGFQRLRRLMVLIKKDNPRLAADAPVMNEVIDFRHHPVHPR